MRLDKFLKVSRVIKRRTVANEACTSGRVSINGKKAKAGAQVAVGNIVSIKFGDRELNFRVVALNEVAKKENAALMFEIIDDTLNDTDNE